MNDYTVKDLANLLGVSKTAIQKHIKSKSVQYDYIERNKQFYSYSKAKDIIKSIRPNFDFSKLEVENHTENSTTQTDNQVEISEAKTENSATETKNSTTDIENSKTKLDNLETITRMLDMLQKEMEKKDKELANKDQQIKDLNEKLDKAYDRIADMANKAQYITAADKTVLIMDKQSQTENSEVAAEVSEDAVKPVKKRWWQKLWGN